MASPASSCPKNRLQTEIEIENPPVRPAFTTIDAASPAAEACISTAAFGIDTSSIAAPSTSGAADPNSRNAYHHAVFLNFHEQDVKNSIASHLQSRLRLNGIQVFTDRWELQKGQKFPDKKGDAIENASVHVAIFSARYAESECCLNDLVDMLKTEACIIPVFYSVKPSELRFKHTYSADGRGIYSQGLQKLIKQRTHHPQIWCTALHTVSKITGFELDAFKGDEGILVEKVVEAVLKNIEKISLHVAKHPVGLHVKVKEFEDTVLLLQQQELIAPQVVGIVGLSGVGKTALAKELLNHKRSHYDRCYFYSCQSKGDFLSNFIFFSAKSKRDFHIDSVDEGIEMLKMQPSSSNVFVVLDGVDQTSQIDAFLPVLSVLGPNSLILITSRNKDVLTGSGVVPEASIYELTGLNEHYSQQLFCFHAFGRSHPVPGFEPLVERFVETCQGLPSSLKRSGELVYGKTDRSYWEDQLDRLPQNLARDMRDRLKSSYDALLRDEKEVFLDAASFFKGETADRAIILWDALGLKSSLLLQALKARSLVWLDSNGRIEMLNNVRDVGREIAEEPSGWPPRLWSWKQVEHLLQQSSGRTESVRGIRTRMDHDDDHSAELSSNRRWTYKLFCNSKVNRCNSSTGMMNVQFIDTEGCQLKPILRRLHSPNPIWLRWLNCPNKALPSRVPLANLRVLELSGCYLERLWLCTSQAPLLLRELVIDSPLSKLPENIGNLEDLERMLLRNTNLKGLPESFGNLKKLKYLDLSHSPSLQKLPISFPNLRNLEHLNLSYCNSLQELPDSFGDLTKLIYLDLSRSSSLETLPNTFGSLRSLQHLTLSYSQSLQRLPNSFGDLAHLNHLDMSNSSSLHNLPNSFHNLIPLDYLDLSGCPNLIASREIVLNTHPSS